MRGLLIGIAVSAVVGSGLGALVASAGRSRVPYGGRPRPMDAQLDRVFEAHLAAAAERGFTLDPQGEVVARPGGGWTRTIELPAGRCVSLTVAAAGCRKVYSASLSGDLTRATTSGLYGGDDVYTVQYCAWLEAESVTAQARLGLDSRCGDDAPREGSLRWATRLAPASGIGDPASLFVSSVSDGSRQPPHQTSDEEREAAAELWLRDNPPPGRQLAEPARSTMEGGALLIPSNRATCHAAYALANRGEAVSVRPRLAEGAGGCPPEGIEPRGRARAAVTGGDHDRILAVVDPGALGAACAVVSVSRLRRGLRSTPPSAVFGQGAAFDQEGALVSRRLSDTRSEEGFVFDDTVCPATEVVAYTVPANDQAPYEVRVHAVPAPEGAVAQPAPEPTEPFPLERPLPEALEDDARRCERSRRPDREACTRLGRALRTAEGGAPLDLARAARAFSRGCEVGSQEACAYHAHALIHGEGVERDRTAGEAAMDRACTAGSPLACAFVADRERLAAGAPAQSLEQAYRRYGTACEGGLESACENRRLLTELELVSPTDG